jgi:KRAB domain-containing zinc finger protein
MSSIKNFSCNLCSKFFTKKSNKTIHIRRRHTFEKPFKCTYSNCKKEFAASSDLKSHEIIHSSEKPFSCDFPNCKKTFARKSSVKIHKLSHNKEKPFKCSYPGCLKNFKHKYDLVHHIRERHGHSDEIKLKCTLCTKTFNRKEHLNKHQEIHESQGKTFDCHICNSKYVQKSTLNRHLREKHTGKFYNYSCSDCNKTYATSRCLSQHKKLKHSLPTLRNYIKCYFCDKNMEKKFYLYNHLKIHIKERAYRCLHCDRKSFIQYFSLYYHMVRFKNNIFKSLIF